MKKLKRRQKHLSALEQLANLCDGICADPLFSDPEGDSTDLNAKDVLRRVLIGASIQSEPDGTETPNPSEARNQRDTIRRDLPN